MPTTISGWLFAIFMLILGFVGSIFSPYLTQRIDAFRGKYSERQRIKNDLEKKKLDEEAEHILSSPNEREYFYFQSIRIMIGYYVVLFMTIIMVAASGYTVIKSPSPAVAPRTVIDLLNALVGTRTALYYSLIEVFMIIILARVTGALSLLGKLNQHQTDVYVALRKHMDQ